MRRFVRNGIESWEENESLRPQAHWRHVEWEIARTETRVEDLPTIQTIQAVYFLGLVDGEHKYREATPEEVEARREKYMAELREIYARWSQE
jgi:hypothetical protein